MTHSRPAPLAIVKIDGIEEKSARVLSVDLSTGGRRLDSATFEFMVPGKQKGASEFHNLDFSKFFQSEVEIIVQPAVGAPFPIHWGKTNGFTVRHDSQGEYFVYTSRQEHHYFGDPIGKIPIRLPNGKIFESQKPLVFNEEIDGQIFPNKASKIDPIIGPVFVDPESFRTASSTAYQRCTAKLWNLAEAADFLCEWLNGPETYIQNPSVAELAKLPTDNKLIRNHQIGYGLFLSQALDALLEPYGYGWFVKLVGRDRRISFYQRGSGFVRTFLMQPPGDQVDMNKTNVEAVNLGLDVVSRAFNQVKILGDYEHYESTFELMPAWDAALDGVAEGLLDKDCDDWNTTPKLARVWRDWVLNEAGDYNRDGFPRAYNLNRVLGEKMWYPNRRKFLPCIALGDDGAPIGQTGGISVEWYDQSDSTWKPLDELGAEGRHVRILDRECGIRFDGQVPPYEIMGQGTPSTSGARIRVTATIISDTRLEHEDFGSLKLISDWKPLILEVPSRFKYRHVDGGSENFPGVFGGSLKSTEVDDTALMRILAAELLNNWDQSSIDGRVVLTGTYFDVQQSLGDPLGGIAGRNINLGTNADGTKFPTIVALNYDFPGQTITVTLDTWQREVSTL